ncbi:hypothetical protein [Demetria terragena]|uniref:hypothetical protein n=1 Tax=Demetria terragena TaxID=63959 RepID=UPI0003639129|nr:hypothetical protein [Demetria terragena]
MHLTIRRTTMGATLVSAAMLVSIQPVSAAEIGTVPASEAAAQLRLGMSSDMTPAAAEDALGSLTVKTGSSDGYDRELFPHWRDASSHGWPEEPNNSCDARGAALYRDGENVTSSSSCTNLKGTWVDPYSAKKYDAASDIDIDHAVSVAVTVSAI